MEPKRVRVLFFAVGNADTPAANVWVKIAPTASGITVTLLHAYPDFKPGIGWHIDTQDGHKYEIDSVNSLTLNCVEIKTP